MEKEAKDGYNHSALLINLELNGGKNVLSRFRNTATQKNSLIIVLFHLYGTVKLHWKVGLIWPAVHQRVRISPEYFLWLCSLLFPLYLSSKLPWVECWGQLHCDLSPALTVPSCPFGIYYPQPPAPYHSSWAGLTWEEKKIKKIKICTSNQSGHSVHWLLPLLLACFAAAVV